MLTALKSLSSDRFISNKCRGWVTLVFHGYDNDTRELEAIPEVREWFAKLFEVWPYWSFFASRVDQTVPLVLTLLLNGEAVVGDPGMVGWSFDLDELKPLLLEMFVHQNELIERQRNYLDKLLEDELLERTIPDKPNSRLQKYRLTEKVRLLLGSLRKENPP